MWFQFQSESFKCFSHYQKKLLNYQIAQILSVHYKIGMDTYMSPLQMHLYQSTYFWLFFFLSFGKFQLLLRYVPSQCALVFLQGFLAVGPKNYSWTAQLAPVKGLWPKMTQCEMSTGAGLFLSGTISHNNAATCCVKDRKKLQSQIPYSISKLHRSKLNLFLDLYYYFLFIFSKTELKLFIFICLDS